MKYILLLLLLIPSLASATAYTSAISGNWSNPATWGQTSLVPGDGDTVTIRSGDSVTVDADITVGATTGTAPGITIAGTSSTVFGQLSVAAGKTLKLRGVNTSTYPAMLISRYGKFTPLSGSTVMVAPISDFQTNIVNNGIVDANGATFTTDPAAISWSNWGGAASTTTLASLTAGNLWSDTLNSWLLVYAFPIGISNAAHTAVGSIGDSSFSLSSGGLTREVASPELITTAGDYWMDYGNGRLVVHPTGFPTTGTFSYYNLQYYGWNISSATNLTYNEAKFAGCTFRYMGATSSTPYYAASIYAKTKDTTGNKLFSFTYNTMEYCNQAIYLDSVNGASGTPINISNNTFRYLQQPVGSPTRPATIALNTSCNWLDINSNSLDIDTVFIMATGGTQTYGNINVRNSTGLMGSLINGMFGHQTLSNNWDNLQIYNNQIQGTGRHNHNMIDSVGTTNAAAKVIVSYNTLKDFYRTINVGSNLDFHDNFIIHARHHGIYCGQTGYQYKLVNVNIFNNVMTGAWSDTGFLHLGYNNFLWIDGINVYNNTFYGKGYEPPSTTTPTGSIGFHDPGDTGTTTLSTNVKMYNNIVATTPLAFSRWYKDSSIYQGRNRLHLSVFDNNLIWNAYQAYNGIKQGSPMHNGVKYNLDATRGITGITLYSPSMALPDSTPRSVAWDSNNKTLQWGNGDPVTINMPTNNTGTITAISSTLMNTTITDTSRSWATVKTDANCPTTYWLKNLTTGTVHAVTTTVSATQLTVVPPMTGGAVGNSYAIYQPEVRLYNAAGSTGDYMDVGVDFANLPSTSQTDTGITWATAAMTTVDPQFIGKTVLGHYPVYYATQNPVLLTAGIQSDGATATYVGANVPEVDTTAPTVNSFTVFTPANGIKAVSLAVAATDANGVSAYSIMGYDSASATCPTTIDPAAQVTVNQPTSYSGLSSFGWGTHTLCAYATDYANNVSAPATATVTTTPLGGTSDTQAPVVTSLVFPGCSIANNCVSTVQNGVPVTISASDNVAVAGYLLSDSLTTVDNTTPGWTPFATPGSSASASTTYSFSATGGRTLRAWVRDTSQNISALPVTASITITPLATTVDIEALKAAILDTPLSEDYATVKTLPTLRQLMFMIWASLSEKMITGTPPVMTVKKLDGATQAMKFAINPALNSITRTE